MAAHINDKGQFQSDKYPTTPPDKVPLSIHDLLAQDLLWEYSKRFLANGADKEFAQDLQSVLLRAGYIPPQDPAAG